MDRNPKISVILPIYNGERYLKECMDSILTQTFRDIEVLCVDDGSTDHTAEILLAYKNNDPRVRILSQKNSGYGASMNRGIDEAAGTYIAVVESDDHMSPDMLEILYNAAEKNQAEVVKGDFYSFAGDGPSRKIQYMQTVPHKRMYEKILDSTATTALFYAMPMTWEGIYRKDFLTKHQIRHHCSPGASFQDNGFWFQVFTWAKRVYFIPKALYYYRGDNEDSSSNQKDFQKLSQMFGEYDFIFDFLNQHPAEKERLYFTYLHFRMDNFLSKFYCADDSARLPIVQQIYLELKDAVTSPGFTWDLYGKKLSSDLRAILNDPEGFSNNPGENMNIMAWNEISIRRTKDDEVNPDITIPAPLILDYTASL